jgi:predicted exporter
MNLRSRLAVAATLLVLAGLTYVATAVVLDSDYSAFLPAGASQRQRLFMSELRDGVASRVVLIELGGAPLEALAQTSRKLAATLAISPHFRYVSNGDATVGRHELDFLERHRYVLSDRLDDPEAFSVEALRTSLSERLDALAGSAGMLEKKFLASDPTGELRRILLRVAPSRGPQRVEGVWFDAAGENALLLAETRAAASDLKGQAQALDTLDQAFVASRTVASITIEYSGAGAMAVRSRALIANDARTLSLLSMAGVFAILLWAYRSLPVVLLCIVPAAVGLLAGVIAVNGLFGSVHGITLAFGATLLGEAVDYPSYLLTQVRPGVTVLAANARIGRMLRLAVMTTACGALALLFSGFPGLAQLGVLTIVGVLIAGAVTWWWLPHVVSERWMPVAAPAWSWLRQSGSRGAGASIWRRRVAVAAITTGAIALAWSNPWWDDDLASMSPLPDAFKAQDARLRGAMGAPDVRFVLVIEGASREAVLRDGESRRRSLERAVAAGSIGGFDLVTDYLPSEATQNRRRQSLPDSEVLRTRLQAAAAGLPFRANVFEPFVDAVAAARQAAPLTPDAYGESALKVKVDSLLRKDDSHWQVVVPLVGVREVEALAGSLPATAQLLDLRGEATAMMAAYRKQAIAYSGVGIVLMFAVLAFGLRSLRGACEVLLPIVLAVIAVAALLVAAGESLTVFHYVALLLTTGIGVNYALVMASAQARDDRAGMWRTLAVVSATALLTFGLLALAHAPVLHAIGVTVFIGVVVSLAFGGLLIEPPRVGPAG